MKHKFISIFLIVILSLTMTACKSKSADIITSQSKVTKENNNSTESSTSNLEDSKAGSTADSVKNTTTDVPNKTTAEVVESKPEEKETFYGEWLIKKQIAYGPVGIYSNDDVKKMLGGKLSYSKEKSMYKDNTCENPTYKKETISQAEFEVSNKIKFSSLGLMNTSIVQITVYPDSSYKSIWNSTGCTFYIKDGNTLILYDGGVYFELAKVAN